MALERAVGEIAGDLRLAVDIRVSFALKGEYLGCQPQCRLSNLLVVGRRKAERDEEIDTVVLRYDRQINGSLDRLAPIGNKPFWAELP